MSEILNFIRNPECWKNGIVPSELMNPSELKKENDRIDEMIYLDGENDN